MTSKQDKLVKPNEVDRLLKRVQPIPSRLGPCPLWLMVSSCADSVEQAQEVINVSLREGEILTALKKAVVRPLGMKVLVLVH